MLYMILFYYNNKPEAKAYQLQYSLPLSNLFFYLEDFPKFHCFCFFYLLFGIEFIDLEVEQKDDINHVYVFSCMSKLYFLVKRISTSKH